MPLYATYQVSADHVHPDYRFTDTVVEVHHDRLDNSYSASHRKLGFGKPFATAEQAIRSLFSDHACSNLVIK